MGRRKMTEEEKKLAREARMEKKRLEKIEAKKNQPQLNWIQFDVEWKKSRMWGMNPHCTIKGERIDGIGFRGDCGYTTSGCGYDKLSTVVGEACNDFMAWLIWMNIDKVIKAKEEHNLPYGISYDERFGVSFGEGIGIDCYRNIFEFLGWSFICVASGNTFDVYRAEKN